MFFNLFQYYFGGILLFCMNLFCFFKIILNMNSVCQNVCGKMREERRSYGAVATTIFINFIFCITELATLQLYIVHCSLFYHINAAFIESHLTGKQLE